MMLKRRAIIFLVILVIVIPLGFFIFQITVGGTSKNRAIVQDILNSLTDYRMGHYSQFADDQTIYDHGSSFVIHGKILIWNIGSILGSESPSFFPSSLNLKISSSLRGDSSDTELTVFLIYPVTNQVGVYEDGTSGYRRDLVVTVVYWPSMRDVAQFTVFGEYPPRMKEGEGSRTGPRVDQNRIIEEINRVLERYGSAEYPLYSQPVAVELEITHDELITEKHIIRQVEMEHPASLVVALQHYPITGYEWSNPVNISDQTVLLRYEHNVIPPKDEATIAGIYRDVSTFLTLEAGTSTIDWEYTRSWESDQEAEFTVKIFVVVK